MKAMRFVVSFLLVFSISIAWCAETTEVNTQEETKLADSINKGINLLKSGKVTESIAYFDEVITAYDEKYKNSEVKIYCARNQAETLMYMFLAATDDPKKAGELGAHKGAIAISATWAYAHYFKGYALVSLMKLDDAGIHLDRAISLSPFNANFLLERMFLYQREKNWDQVLETALNTEKHVELSNPQEKIIILTAAWRGAGFALIEQGKFVEAEKYFHKCLELDKNDSKALNELRYIEGLKTKKAKADL